MGNPINTKGDGVSHSAWSAWIEILKICLQAGLSLGRTPHGVRGLKLCMTELMHGWLAVALRMECVD